MRDLEKEPCTVPNIGFIWRSLVKTEYDMAWWQLCPGGFATVFMDYKNWTVLEQFRNEYYKETSHED